jgi:hypothetical protein
MARLREQTTMTVARVAERLQMGTADYVNHRSYRWHKGLFVEQPAKVNPPSPCPSPSGRGNEGVFAELGWAVAEPPPNAGVGGEPRDARLGGGA